jgi:hypothetical protein
MPLSNAEKQRRWRRRLISLTDDPFEIASRLIGMEDQGALLLIFTLLNKHLNPVKDGRCKFVRDDGGRSRSGIARGGKGDDVGDCAVRAIAIATQRPYREVWNELTGAAVRHVANAKRGWGKRARRRSGVSLSLLHADHGNDPEVYGPYLETLGWRFKSTKDLPRGKGLHLRPDQLPGGSVIVDLPGHLCAVIDGVLRDVSDCSREGRARIRGYWSLPG